MKLLIINGPNMNLLGVREPEIYGTGTYEELVDFIREQRGEENELKFVQTNHEGDIIDEIHQAYFENYDGIVLNAGGYAYTSIAIMDAMRAVRTPVVEVHLVEPLLREDFRHHTYTGTAAIGTIAGKGFDGYVEAIDLLSNLLGDIFLVFGGDDTAGLAYTTCQGIATHEVDVIGDEHEVTDPIGGVDAQDHQLVGHICPAISLEGLSTGPFLSRFVGILDLSAQGIIGISLFSRRPLCLNGALNDLPDAGGIGLSLLRKSPGGQQKECKKKERHGFLQWFHRWLLSRFSAYYHTVILFSGFSMFVYNLF